MEEALEASDLLSLTSLIKHHHNTNEKLCLLKLLFYQTSTLQLNSAIPVLIDVFDIFFFSH